MTPPDPTSELEAAMKKLIGDLHLTIAGYLATSEHFVLYAVRPRLIKPGEAGVRGQAALVRAGRRAL